MLRKHLNFIAILFCVYVHPLVADDIASKVDEYIGAYVVADRFSGSILIARGGEILLSRGYGYANREWNIENTPDTKFRLGSVTKQFTTLAILQLHQRGKLSLEDALSRFIPEYPRGDEITIHHLMSHTSGIPNFTAFPDYVETMVLPSTLEQTIARFRDKPLDFEPGNDFRYSNSGYILLGYIIESVSGQSYEDFLRTHIFDRLGMEDTGYDDPTRIISRRASGYQFDGQAITNAPFIDMSIPHAAGALYSTVEDLYKWDRALYTDRLLNDELLSIKFTPVMNNYAYGWIVSSMFDRKVVSHGGGINGFQTNIARFVDDDVCIIVLSNIIPSPVREITRDLAAIIFDQPYEVPKTRTAVELPESILNRYVGSYELAPDFLLRVTVEGNRIFTQATGQPRVEIFPMSETEFFLTAVEAEITFTFDEKGNVTGLILHQGGMRMPAARVQ